MTPTQSAITASCPGQTAGEPPVVYWHRQLPPFEAEMIGEHVLEATSGRVPGTLAHRDELWDRCYRSLIANTEERFAQEVARLGGHYAHVLDESIHSRRDDVAGEAWLHGRFTYMLYRRPRQTRDAALPDGGRGPGSREPRTRLAASVRRLPITSVKEGASCSD